VTAARPSSGPPRPAGATPVGRKDDGGGRKKALVLGALLLALLVAAGLLLSQCGSDDPERDSAGAAATSSGAATSSDDAEGSSSSPSSSASGSSSSAPADGGASGGGQLVTADGQDVLALAGQGDAATALGGLADQTVTGTGVQVLSVPADEGFWVGTSDEQRVWVQLTGEEGESPYQVTEGDVVDFEGTVVAHDASFAEQVGLADADGAAQLTELASHIEAAKGSVTLSE
jgi:hypothetical protein